MSLSKHVVEEDIIKAAADRYPHHSRASAKTHTTSTSVYGSRYESSASVPKFKLPEQGISPSVAYQLIHDETSLDGNPSLNLASFVHTWMPEEADKLMMENIGKNLVDEDEYPATTKIHSRCVSMIADLWNVPTESSKALGTATTGSSEAIMLGGLALKKRWQAKMKAAGKNIHEPGPNIVMGGEAQVALEKFARYFDIEARLVPVTVESNYVMDPKEAIKQCDENTIGVFVILGSTYSGHFEDVQGMSDELDKLEKEKGIDIPIHVDAASGGFFAPFAYPDYIWDFRISRVNSINASGHKYGRSYVGVGWVIWRSEDHLPKELIFELHYLGSTELSFNLNFSRPAHPIIGQYFNLINLGFDGYRQVSLNDLRNARTLSRALELSGYFTVISDVHRLRDAEPGSVANAKRPDDDVDEDDENLYKRGLPVVAFRFTDDFQKQYPDIEQAWVQHKLREEGWIVPNYALPPTLEKTEILRVVIRENFNAEMVERLVESLFNVVESFINEEGSYVKQTKTDRPKGKAAGAAGGREQLNGNSLESHLGSANPKGESSEEYSGTYAKQC